MASPCNLQTTESNKHALCVHWKQQKKKTLETTEDEKRKEKYYKKYKQIFFS